MSKKIVIILALFILGLGIIFKDNLVQHDSLDIYMTFDPENDFSITKVWADNSHLFPKNFDPTKTLIKKEELNKLDSMQLKKFDSISAWYYEKPRKVVRQKALSNKEYGISIDNNEYIKFSLVSSSVIGHEEIEGINFVSIDSIITILTPSHLKSVDEIQNHIWNSSYKFYVIEHNKSKPEKILVKPEHYLFH